MRGNARASAATARLPPASLCACQSLPAPAHRVQVYDRIIKLNGKELKKALMHSIGNSTSLSLTLERPPKASGSSSASRRPALATA